MEAFYSKAIHKKLLSLHRLYVTLNSDFTNKKVSSSSGSAFTQGGKIVLFITIYHFQCIRINYNASFRQAHPKQYDHVSLKLCCLYLISHIIWLTCQHIRIFRRSDFSNRHGTHQRNYVPCQFYSASGQYKPKRHCIINNIYETWRYRTNHYGCCSFS